MPLPVFTLICNNMGRNNLLNDTHYTMVKHQMHPFLYITTTGALHRAAQERFQHSPKSISCLFKTVVEAITLQDLSLCKPLDVIIPILIWYYLRFNKIRSFSHFSKIAEEQLMGLLCLLMSLQRMHRYIGLIRASQLRMS